MLSTVKNWLYFFAGIIFLALAKTKNIIQGYSSPKPFSIKEVARCIEYDIKVVENWLTHFLEYTSANNEQALNGKRILELGPGSDLGVGLYLLSKGVSEYNAVDVNNLVDSVPNGFYEELFSYLKDQNNDINVLFLREELNKTRSGHNDKLNYLCRNDFDIAAALENRKVDIIFSQAAFEHFDNIDETIKSLSNIAVKGTIAIMLIDLKTHSRWIRDKDPINIYRYPKWLYNIFSFRGIPNRIRPYQYKETFEKYGWGNVIIEPANLLSVDSFNFVKGHLNNNFRQEKNQMNYLSVWLYASKL